MKVINFQYNTPIPDKIKNHHNFFYIKEFMTISFLKLIQKFIQYKIFYSFIFLEKYTLEKHSL